jgi:hypothetical protein
MPPNTKAMIRTPAPSRNTPVPAAVPTSSAAVPALHAALPHGALFGAPPLVGGEDAAAYDALLARVAHAVAPADVLEEMWVRDVVDLAWEALRLRRLKALLLTAAAPEGLAAALTGLIGAAPARELADAWATGGRRAARQVDKVLARAGLVRETITAHTLALRIDQVERIDHMITFAESRRSAAMREIERHRAVLADALRAALAAEDAADADAEIEDVPPVRAPRARDH